ncbi:MAG: hypothetical protein ACHQWU_03020 [Gemmatimonadales bacterium]|jgi:hypothetical protein
MIQLGLVPIVPILLLPFVLIFFVIVFPIWGVALGVLGLLLLIARGLDRLAGLIGVHALKGVADAIAGAFHWVLTFGGLAKRVGVGVEQASPRR